MKVLIYTSVFYLFILINGCTGGNTNNINQITSDTSFAKTSELLTDTLSIKIYEVVEYKNKIDGALSLQVPILMLQDSNTAEQKLAQEICFSNQLFTKYCKDSISNSALRNEIFNVYKARQSDFDKNTLPLCNGGGCYKVEMYNFALNLSTVALVNINSKQILQVLHLPNTQPEIPNHLRKLALKIAAENKEVQNDLGFKPTINNASMSDTKTALNRSYCERSRHLCVAPTFVKNEKALWVIVDLTNLNIAGLRWTNVGANNKPLIVSERKIQNEKITECFCKTENFINQQGWKFGYMLTNSDGLRISAVTYNNKPVLSSAKLVDWHVSYSGTDGFGYSDAIGCPYFSTAAVVSREAPKVENILEGNTVIGFALIQNFFSEGWPAPCDYNYQQRYEFFNDGKFRISAASLGRGCGNEGTYRPVLRIAFATASKSFSEWNGSAWNNMPKETWQLQQATTNFTTEGYQYKIENTGSYNYFIEPGRGQFKDGGRGDNAYTFISVNKPGRDEGESDLVTIGPCCNTDYKQGPEKFIEPNPEKLENENLVLWYVPQMKNDNRKGMEYCWAENYVKNGVMSTRTYPCFAGPMFVPIK
jgi:Copper amine oxidase, enzyme domain